MRLQSRCRIPGGCFLSSARGRPRQRVVARLVFAAALLVAAPSAAQTPASSYSKSSSGTKVLYLFLEDLGYRTRRIFSVDELSGGLKRPAMDVVLFVGAVDPRTARRALAWARSGKLIIFAPPLVGKGGHCKEVSFSTVTIKRKLNLGGKNETHAEIDPKLKLRHAACVVEAPETSRVLVSTKSGALVFEHAVGQGKLLVLAHDDLLTNFTLDDDDLAVIVRRWMAVNAKPQARVAYFEHHQGGALWKMLKKAHLLPFFFQGLLFLVFVLWKITPRFGDADTLTPVRRRAFAEHARSLGTLYQRAGASGYALMQIYDRFVRRLRYREGGAGVSTPRVSGAAGAAERAALAERLATRTGGDAADVDSLLAQVEYAAEPQQPKDARGAQRDFRLASAISDLARRAGMTEHAGRRRGSPRGHR